MLCGQVWTLDRAGAVYVINNNSHGQVWALDRAEFSYRIILK